jgi:antitoxin component YwqK of YwqJK toxin-antitoxin module
MLLRALYLFSVILLISCEEVGPVSNPENIVPKSSLEDFTPAQIKEYAPVVELNQKVNKEIKNSILHQFDKPLHSYPKIESSMTEYGKDGLLYRKGVAGPFSGTVVNLDENRVALLEASFLQGQPHGVQLRRNKNGGIIMEALMNRGILTGVKTKWWDNGSVKEEEYWGNGSYKGRSVWDEQGRLVKEVRAR